MRDNYGLGGWTRGFADDGDVGGRPEAGTKQHDGDDLAVEDLELVATLPARVRHLAHQRRQPLLEHSPMLREELIW